MNFQELWNKHEDYWTDHLIPNNEEFWNGPEPFEGYRIFMLAAAVNHEAIELQRETNFKWWKTPKSLDADKIDEEIIDILHFAIQLAMERGMDVKKMIKIYDKKLDENINRQVKGY